VNAASLYAAIVRVRARQARARRMLAALDSLDSARGGFYGFGKKRLKSGKTKGIAKKVMKLPRGSVSPHLFYYVKGGYLYAKKR